MQENFVETHPLTGAIIGFGNVAMHAHLPTWRQNRHFIITAVVEPFADRAALVKEILPDARVYGNVEELLRNEELDFVDICTPPCSHADLMLTMCRSGLHVLCEKPLVASTEMLDEIQEAASRSERVIFTVNNWKYAPLWSKVREILSNGILGTIREVDLSVFRTPNSGGGASDWRKCLQVAGGGILLDHGWHHLYLLLALIGRSPTCLSAKMDCIEGSTLEESVDLTILFPEAEARLHLTWRSSIRKNSGVIRCDSGKILINDDHLVVDVNSGVTSRFDFPGALSAGSHHLEWMMPVIEDFRQEVMDRRVRGNNFAEARWCVILSDLAYRSYREGACLLHVGDQVKSL